MDNTNLHIWTPPRAKGDCRVDGESGCSHISGLFKELDSTLLALMEIRAPSPGQPNGLEGQSVAQGQHRFTRRRSDGLPITDKTTSATIHGEPLVLLTALEL